jgi:Lrp/AsnC family leucine-responsive transcriptional regulator
MDKLNWAILEALQENARASYSEIGRKIGLSAPAVAERILKMEEGGIIQGYKTVLNLDKIGRPLKAIIGFRVHQTSQMTSFLRLLKESPEVYECIRVTGKDCLFIKVAVSNSEQLENLIDRFVKYGETTTSAVLSSPVEGGIFRMPSPS